jgi:hypothetical protein
LEELANSAPPKRFKKPKIKPKVSQDQPDIPKNLKLNSKPCRSRILQEVFS